MNSRHTLTWFTALAAVACGVAVASGARAGELNVRLDTVPSADGKVYVSLFDRAAEFPNGKRFDARMAPAAKGSVTLRFENVPPGRYALAAFHDANGNGRLDSTLVGLPTEAYGASRDARGRMGPPSFDDAVLTVGAEPLAIAITLH